MLRRHMTSVKDPKMWSLSSEKAVKHSLINRYKGVFYSLFWWLVLFRLQTFVSTKVCRQKRAYHLLVTTLGERETFIFIYRQSHKVINLQAINEPTNFVVSTKQAFWILATVLFLLLNKFAQCLYERTHFRYRFILV